MESGLFDKVVVSTDDDEIASVAREYGAEVPFKRPSKLADSLTGTVPVIRHAIEELEQLGDKPDYVCCIYATASFVTDKYLKEGLELLEDNPKKKFTFSITSYGAPIFRSIKIGEEGELLMFWPEHEQMRSQDLPDAYHDAGQFYWGTRSAFLNETSLYCSHSLPVILPRYRVQDIDNEEDWKQAELMFQLLHHINPRIN